MTRVRIKVCGLTSEEAVDATVECGIDAVGFVFAPSPRRITPERAEALARRLPSFVLRVAVFSNATAAEVAPVIDRLSADRIQIEAGSFVGLDDGARRRAIAVFHDGPMLLQEIDAFRRLPIVAAALPTILIDGKVSGGGEAWDWGAAARISRTERVVLAGGLDPGNVERAIRIVRPYAVDVSSGVESSKGIKDRALIEAFVAAVRRAEVER